MRLERFEIEGYQSYAKRTTIDLDPQVTFIAGRNNVGKSALLRGLRAMADRPEGGRILEVGFHWRVSREELLASIREEPARELLGVELGDAADQRLVAQFSAQGPTPAGTCTELSLPDADLTTGPISPNTQPGWTRDIDTPVPQVKALIDLAKRQAQRVSAILPRRVDLGRRVLLPQEALHPDGRNLTEMLFTLSSNDVRRFEAVQGFLREAFPDIERVTIPVTDGPQNASGELALLHFDRDAPVPLNQSGSGVEQMLVLVTRVLTAEANSLILIDEPQAYLHPHAERSLLKLLETHSQHQYVIATHSHQLLGAHPLRCARLITKEGAQSAIAQPANETDVLEELGVTAADLWLTEQILWVEGPSDQAAIEALIDAAGLSDSLRSLEVRPMPENSSRFTAKDVKQAQSAYKFCEQTTAAVSPLPLQMLFMFDADGKTDAFREEIQRRSNNQAMFLTVRELENCFLERSAITSALGRRAERVDHAPPTVEEVGARLEQLLGATDDKALFPDGLPVGLEPEAAVKGSVILDRLFVEFTASAYDKVADAALMVREMLVADQTELGPLFDVLRSFDAKPLVH